MQIQFGGAGALAVLSLAFIAGIGFRRQGWGDDDNPVGQHCNTAWGFLQPMLFALIGTEIQVCIQGTGAEGTWGCVTENVRVSGYDSGGALLPLQ